MSAIKKKNWIWVAVDRDGRQYIDFCIGDRSAKTGMSLWEKIKSKLSNPWLMTDYWAAYELFLQPDRHIQSKAETFTVEGYNSIFRHFLARLRRKAKCYSKSLKMLALSIELLIFKRNGQLEAIIG